MRDLFIGVQGAMGLQAGLSGLVRLNDAINLTNARLRQATASMQQFSQAQAQALRLSAETGAGYESIVALYSRLSLTAKDYGLTQERIAAVTEITARALKVSGAEASESASVITQLSQALGSGVLRGDEFNSIMENGGRLAKALADGLGLPIGQLRNLAEQGLLTTDIVVKALESQRAAIAAEAQAMPQTVGASLVAVRDAFGQTVARMDQASGASSVLGAALSALARNMDAVAATGLVAAVSAAAVVIVRKTQSVWASMTATLSEVAAERQAIATSVAHAQARVSYATAELAAAQAAVASASGMQRLSVVQSALIPAQQRLAAAQAGLSAALSASTLAARGLSAVLAFVGGPVGLITTLLTAGVTAWALWGSSASRAADKAREAIDRARDVMQRFRKEQQFGTGDTGAINEGIAAQKSQIADLEAQYQQATLRAKSAKGNVDYAASMQSKADAVAQRLKAARTELTSLQSAQADIARRDAQNAAPGAPTALGRELMRKQFDAYVAQYRDKAGQLQAAIAELQSKAKAAGLSQDSAEYQKALAAVRAKFAPKGTGGAGLSSGAELSAIRAQADAEFALLKDGLARAQTAYDDALGEHLVSIKGYYAAKTALDQQAIDADIARTRAQLDAQQGIAATGKTENDRLRARGEVSKLEADLIVLNNKRADVETANAAKAAQAESRLADALAKVREELAQATGAQTDADRRAAIASQYADLRRQLVAEGQDTALVDKLIDVKAAQANLNALQAKWQQTLQAMRDAQQAVNLQQQAGLLTPAQATAQTAGIQRQGAVTLQGLLPGMEAAAQAIGPEQVAHIQAWRNELAQAQQVADQMAPVWNDIGSTFSSALQGMVQGTQTWAQAVGSLFKGVSDAFLKHVVIDPFQQWVAQQAKMLTMKLGFSQQEQAMNTATAAQTVAAKTAETTTVVSANAAQAGSGAASALAGIPYVGPALAVAGMAAMVAAVMALLGKGFATGGLVRGPGTGTSDSIPARLSAGEYVVRAAAVRQIGTGALDAINGLKRPPSVVSGRMAFAAGGLVPAAAPDAAAHPQAPGVRIINAIDPSITADYMNSPSGEKVVLNIISRNARAVRSALG